MENKKIRIGVLFGGRSGEHEVSLVSAQSVLSSLNPAKYEVIPVGITREGVWLEGKGVMDYLRTGVRKGEIRHLEIRPEPRGAFMRAAGESGGEIALDVVFPILHGTFGEDGTIQGLLELAEIPYVGAGVVGSAAGMDKILQKYVLRGAGIPVVDFLELLSAPDDAGREHTVMDIERQLGYPMFVKPANLGSSVGISKASNREELAGAIDLAFSYDLRIIVEKGVISAREFECAILGMEDPKASVVGEIIPSNEFYDYDAKYIDGKSRIVIPAEIPEELSQRVRRLARMAFLACACEGMARVDFLYEPLGDSLYLNEINTIPGFTSISMYPKLFEASGIRYPDLLDRLITLALERAARKKALRLQYQPKSDWFKDAGT